MAGSTVQQYPLAGRDEPEPDLGNAERRSSSRGTGDVRIAFAEGFIAMGDSGRPESPSLIFAPAEWGAFVSGARRGESDLTRGDAGPGRRSGGVPLAFPDR